MNNIQQSSSTQPSRFHQAWESVKAGATSVFSSPLNWASATSLAVLAGAITAAAGFGGILGGALAACPFFTIAVCMMQPGHDVPDGSLVAYSAALLSFAALGVGVVGLGFVPAVSVVLTMILAGVAVVGIAGTLIAYILKARRRSQTIENLPQKAQTLYRVALRDPSKLRRLDRSLLRKNDLTKTSDANNFFYSEDALFKHVKELDVKSDDNSQNEFDEGINDFFEHFKPNDLPALETIKCDRKWLLRNAGALRECGNLKRVKVDNETISGEHIKCQLRQYEIEGQLDNLSEEAKPFYRKIMKNHSLMNKLDLNDLIENNFTKMKDIKILLEQFGDHVETFEADFSKINMENLDDEIKQGLRTFDGANFPFLKHLSISNGENIEIKNLRKSPQLKTVTLNNCPGIKTNRLCDDLVWLRPLDKITIKNCGPILKDEEIRKITDYDRKCDLAFSE